MCSHVHVHGRTMWDGECDVWGWICFSTCSRAVPDPTASWFSGPKRTYIKEGYRDQDSDTEGPEGGDRQG